MAHRKWHIRLGGETLGPIPESLAVLMLKQNRLQFTDYAWSEGLDQWTRLGEIESFGRFAPSYPQVPVPTNLSIEKDSINLIEPPPPPKEILDAGSEENVAKRNSVIRQKERIPVRGKVTLKNGDSHKVVNVSETGVLVACGQGELPLGDEITFTLKLDGLEKDMSLTGILIREETGTDHTLIGIEFTRMNPAHRRELQSFISAKRASRKAAA